MLLLRGGGLRSVLWLPGDMIHRGYLGVLSHRKPQVGWGGSGNVCGIFILMTQQEHDL